MRLPGSLASMLAGGAPGTLVAYLATSRRDGSPNLYPVPFTDVVGDDLVLMPDLFAQKTKVNLNENSAVSMSFALDGEELPWVLEGRGDIVQWGHPRRLRLFGLQAGEVLDRWGDWDETVEPVIDAPEESARPTVFAQRGVIVFRAEKIVEV